MSTSRIAPRWKYHAENPGFPLNARTESTPAHPATAGPSIHATGEALIRHPACRLPFGRKIEFTRKFNAANDTFRLGASKSPTSRFRRTLHRDLTRRRRMSQGTEETIAEAGTSETAVSYLEKHRALPPCTIRDSRRHIGVCGLRPRRKSRHPTTAAHGTRIRPFCGLNATFPAAKQASTSFCRCGSAESHPL